MSEIVGAVAVPHTPHFPSAAEKDDELGRELRRLYGAVALHVKRLRPDVIVFVTADHYNNFFVTSIPIFSIGVGESATGPVDYELPQRKMPIDAHLARSLQTHLVKSGFDVGQTQEFRPDHPFTIPLNFVVEDVSVPIVPVFVSAFLRPLPTAERCYAFGKAIRAAVEQESGPQRVLVLATGSFSLEIGGPRMSATSHTGVPAPDWMDAILHYLEESDWDRLVAEATDEQLAQAGNAGGETLLWVTMLGALGAPQPPLFLEAQREWGHAYGVWATTSEKGDQ
jgi:aromatic ring-opening dioxygenase catalytic subunit (LigB family)